jgi:uncharacterized membrane protein
VALRDKHNLTMLNEFILMGITDLPQLQVPLFRLFLTVYMVSVMGNLGSIILTLLRGLLFSDKRTINATILNNKLIIVFGMEVKVFGVQNEIKK